MIPMNSPNFNPSTNFLIIEAYTDANIGSCALVENAMKIIHTKFPNAKIKVMAQYPEAFKHLYNVDSMEDIFMFPTKQPLLKKIIWLIQNMGWVAVVMICLLLSGRKELNSGINFPFKNRIAPILWADYVISVGAERLNDKYFKNVPFSLLTFWVSKLLGRKVIIFPATYGPFFFWWSKFFCKHVLPLVDLNYTRDELSTNTLIKDLNIPFSKVIDSVDIAVLQESVDKKKAYSLIPARPDETIVGVSILRWSYFKNQIETPYSNYSAYVREMAKFVNHLVSNYDVSIVFYPTNFKIHSCADDDLAVAYDIMPLIESKHRIKIIKNLPTPAQFQGMLSCSAVNITTRMHACILSTNSCVPTISINYLPKLKGYMESLGLSEFSIDIEEFSAEKTIHAFQLIWPDRDKWTRHLRNVMKIRKERLWKTMERLDAVIN